MESAAKGSALTNDLRGDDLSLRSLLDERACANVIQSYGALADGDDVDGFVELFTPDAFWQRADGTIFQGHAEIRSAYLGRPATGFSCHLIANITVCLAGAEANVQSKAVVLKSSDTSQPVSTAPSIAMASYVDRMLRCDDGLWRIAHRSSHLLLNLPNT